MGNRCFECGKKGASYLSVTGVELCQTCHYAELATRYLRRMEANRAKFEGHNKRAYANCRELSAWLSLYRFGNEHARSRAATYLIAWGKPAKAIR